VLLRTATVQQLLGKRKQPAPANCKHLRLWVFGFGVLEQRPPHPFPGDDMYPRRVNVDAVRHWRVHVQASANGSTPAPLGNSGSGDEEADT
jgi:hypothetical protein